ncbi:hypothetical protein [Microbacterium sp. Se5.02b]|uniref:hypothetical protein n=1 Tax=Microbacterium sp. Se5.02b TaxID=2864103 RepID=UPI00215D7D7C|nr:hypothetical protein [Microbacterium sp. Se5.02b]
MRDILDSEVPEDSLSTPDRPGKVTLLTPATALGTEFDAVVVAGVQDGVWPNVRLRGGLLQTWRLADTIQAARTGTSVEPPASSTDDVRHCTTNCGSSSERCRGRGIGSSSPRSMTTI